MMQQRSKTNDDARQKEEKARKERETKGRERVEFADTIESIGPMQPVVFVENKAAKYNQRMCLDVYK